MVIVHERPARCPATVERALAVAAGSGKHADHVRGTATGRWGDRGSLRPDATYHSVRALPW